MKSAIGLSGRRFLSESLRGGHRCVLLPGGGISDELARRCARWRARPGRIFRGRFFSPARGLFHFDRNGLWRILLGGSCCSTRAVVRSRSLPDWLRPACRVLAGPSIPGWGENGEGFGESPRGMTPAGSPIFFAPVAHGAEGVIAVRPPAGFPPSRRWRTGGLRRSRLLLPG